MNQGRPLQFSFKDFESNPGPELRLPKRGQAIIVDAVIVNDDGTFKVYYE